LGFVTEGAAIYQLGATRDELGGSEWAHEVHAHLGGRPPMVDLPAERALATVLVQGSAEGLLESAHDLADGGLGQALVESCLRRGAGARVWLDGLSERDGVDAFVAVFSESSARAVVAVDRAGETRLVALCGEHGVPVVRIGVVGAVGDGAELDVAGQFTVPLAELRAAHEGTLPALFGP
jgi:phosphoribosylformylglycinamidine synthase